MLTDLAQLPQQQISSRGLTPHLRQSRVSLCETPLSINRQYDDFSYRQSQNQSSIRQENSENRSRSINYHASTELAKDRAIESIRMELKRKPRDIILSPVSNQFVRKLQKLQNIIFVDQPRFGSALKQKLLPAVNLPSPLKPATRGQPPISVSPTKFRFTNRTNIDLSNEKNFKEKMSAEKKDDTLVPLKEQSLIARIKTQQQAVIRPKLLKPRLQAKQKLNYKMIELFSNKSNNLDQISLTVVSQQHETEDFSSNKSKKSLNQINIRVETAAVDQEFCDKMVSEADLDLQSKSEYVDKTNNDLCNQEALESLNQRTDVFQESLYEETQLEDTDRSHHQSENLNLKVTSQGKQVKFRHQKANPIQYNLCCGRCGHHRDLFHFHEENESKIHQCDFCARVNKNTELDSEQFEKYKKIRPSLIEHRATVETELMRARRLNAPPHIVMDKILKHEAPFAKSILPATDDVLFNYGKKTSTQTNSFQKQHPSVLSGHSNVLTEPTQVGSYQDRKIRRYGDWQSTPLYQEFEGINQMSAIKSCISESEVMTKLLPRLNMIETVRVKLDITVLNHAADKTTLDYMLHLINHKVQPILELNRMYQKATITLMSQLVRIGKVKIFNKMMEQNEIKSEDYNGVKESVWGLIDCCLRTNNVIDQVKAIFRKYKKHLTAITTLNEIATVPDFKKYQAQVLVDYFVKQGARLCKEITEFLNQEDILVQGDDENEGHFLFGQKCLREIIIEDAVKIYELMEGPVTMQLFNTSGNFL